MGKMVGKLHANETRERFAPDLGWVMPLPDVFVQLVRSCHNDRNKLDRVYNLALQVLDGKRDATDPKIRQELEGDG